MVSGWSEAPVEVQCWPGYGRNDCLKEKWIHTRHASGDPLELGDGLDENADSSLSPGF